MRKWKEDEADGFGRWVMQENETWDKVRRCRRIRL